MFVSLDSPVGARFFAAIKSGQGINKSSRLAGIYTGTGYRFLQVAYLRHRRDGLPSSDVLELLGFQSSHVLDWESQLTKPERHHLRVDAVDEDRFWALFDAGMRAPEAAKEVNVSRPTADRWLQRRFFVSSPETIYRALLLREDHGLTKGLAAKLRTGRRMRKTRWISRYKQGSRIRNMTMIDRRPEEHSSKLVAGNWEGDLIVGAGSVSAMVTLRERKTQYGIIVNLPKNHTAASENAAVTAAFKTLPRHLKKSLTWDQGTEMSSHEDLTEATGVPVYFAERSSPWQRGANENFNGLARQFFPKGTDLSRHSADHVAKVMKVMKELNNRPRRASPTTPPRPDSESSATRPTSNSDSLQARALTSPNHSLCCVDH